MRGPRDLWPTKRWAPGAALLAALLWTPAAVAQEARGDTLVGADWRLERVTLTDGKTLEGLVRAEGAAGVEFTEVRRRRGKPMALVVHALDRADIQSLVRLSPDEQQELARRLEHYKRRTLVEARQMDDLVLSAETPSDGQSQWHYEGAWFVLTSAADETTTRRLIVRLEQIFAAYRQLVAPRFAGRGQLQVRIFGSMEQYNAALARAGLRINNPAVYLSKENLILAGSELNRFDAELQRVKKQHQEIMARLDGLVADARERIIRLGDDLKRNNVPAADRARIVLAEHRKWHDERQAVRQKIAALDQRNAAKFNDVTARMFRRLAHEAFHAYLETNVYPRQQSYDVPRWLNEGLAQIFEAGLLEADSLRIDAPNLEALAQLQEDLRGAAPLELAELLKAGSDGFLSAHRSDGALSRAYYYSWGLAYYLAFEHGGLRAKTLDAYVSSTARGADPIERFEKLSGEPLDVFQPKWRQAMLAIKNGP